MIKYYHQAIEARRKYKAWLKSYKPSINPKTNKPLAPRPEKRKANPETHYFSQLYKTEEGRAKVLSGREGGKVSSGTGVPDGYTTEMMVDIRHQAQLRAKRMVKKISETNDIKSEYARQALETVAEIMQTPGSDPDRLKASRVC